MATLALSLAGQVVGGAVGGPVGATIGRALGALAGSAVDSAIFGERPRPAQSDVRLTGSSEGGPIPRVYGWSRVSGNIIWATRLERIAAESSGIKGFGRREAEDTIAASFALALCEGEVAHLGRIWADGKLLETDGLDIRFYRGTDDQQPDGFIVARQGAAPAYRGICYLMFERLDLTPFGNRIPNISVEICRPVGDLEPAVRAVCVIPGSTEFGYDPVPRVRVLGRGRTAAENCHLSGVRSDWDISIDELTALCPNLEHVGLVVSWFGTDLRCGECVVEPRVENTGKEVNGTDWAVAGISRDAANVVSTHQCGPAYGGTPSDAAVVAAIADLRARGLKVTLYPFVMMDVPHGNGRVDPYTLQAGQPAYPWRGRITCHPAPGVAGSPDGTGAAAGQVADFMANGYRQMILHYAQLAESAGGVDAMLIGSEMRGLTWVRSGAESFPFVDALRGLAADVRAIVGAGTKITYAADWSEYSGLQPENAPGDKIFHLDPLWADGNIDAIGIDNYMPLADWRDGEGHLDAEVAGSIHDLDYLKGNIAGGEGFDWFYASQEDREAQLRTPIADGAHGQDWVWRYKDLVSFWSEPHHNRIGGVRLAPPTDWVPRSKPYWLTEFGCGAVDKGPNAPNAFGDPKSSEDARPPFSGGTPDPLVQRQALRACHRYWQAPGAHNPVSPVYGRPMLDADRIYLWCWDARPYPAFPGMEEVWSDAANYETGHWLNGRLGSAGADEVLAAMAGDFGVPVAAVDAYPPLVRGLGIEAVTSLRDASASLVEALGLAVRDTEEGIAWRRADTRAVAELARDDLVAGEGPLASRKRGDPSEQTARLTFNYFDRDRDYQTASVLAVSPRGERNAGVETGLVIDPADARAVAEAMLRAMRRADDRLEMALPPSMLGLEAGDLIEIEGQADGPFVVDAVRDGAARAVSASAHGGTVTGRVMAPTRRMPRVEPPIAATPVIAVAHLPRADGGTELVASGFAEPWPGAISLRDGTGSELGRLTSPGVIGELTQALAEGPGGVWDRAGAIELLLYGGHLASSEPLAVLASANRLAIETDAGQWEVIGFERAELVGPATYRLSGLLRGLDATRSGVAVEGNRVLVLDRNCVRLAVPQSALGDERTLRAYAGSRDAEGTEIGVDMDIGAALPLAPVHLKAARNVATGDVVLSWIRRSRVEGNAWTFADVPLDFAPERYRVSVIDGSETVRTLEVGAAGLVYAAAEQIADFGGLPEAFGFSVEQISPVLGAGHKAQGVFP